MKLVFSYREVVKSNALEHHVAINLEKMQDYFGDTAECKVVFKKEKKIYICEITVYRNSDVFRSEKKSEDMYTSVDLCVDTLWGKVRKYKSKIEKTRREKSKSKVQQALNVTSTPEEEKDSSMDEALLSIVGVRYKDISPETMSVADAIIAIELLGHDFYIFLDEKSGKTSILYKRDQEKHGKEAYGVIEVTK